MLKGSGSDHGEGGREAGGVGGPQTSTPGGTHAGGSTNRS